MPPADFRHPSAAFSILKSFLEHNAHSAEIIYWNFLLDKYIEREKEMVDLVEAPRVALLPYYYIIAEKEKDEDALNRIIFYYQGLNPENLVWNSQNSLKLFRNIKTKIFKTISEVLNKIDFNNVLLWGISGKNFQWVPGIILAKEIKKINPDAKIVFGGFGGKDEAFEIMNLSKDIDFTIYGEGEYPLLELCNELEKGKRSFNKIPRFIYRDKNQIISSEIIHGVYLDMNNYIYPDYSDFKNSVPKKIKKDFLQYPINSIRACRWNRCRFCNYSMGYKYRERSPECIVKEIEYMSDKYDITAFNFVDNDIIGRDIKRFEHLLDLLIESSLKNEKIYTFWAQIIIHKNLEANIYKKMSLAGFKGLFAGYEAISDNILQKMDKNQRFADNILFLKYCMKYDLEPKANLIKGIPDETIHDVKESCDNMHFLRFYFHGKYKNFKHYQGNFALYKEAKYFKTVSDKEFSNYSLDTFCYYLPSKLVNKSSHLFALMKNKLTNNQGWINFIQVENYYQKCEYSYKLLKNNNIIFYKEYLDKNEIDSILFDEPEYADVLISANNKVISFEELYKNMTEKYSYISANKIKKILSELKKKFLLYYNEDFSDIITIIDMEMIF